MLSSPFAQLHSEDALDSANGAGTGSSASQTFLLRDPLRTSFSSLPRNFGRKRGGSSASLASSGLGHWHSSGSQAHMHVSGSSAGSRRGSGSSSASAATQTQKPPPPFRLGNLFLSSCPGKKVRLNGPSKGRGAVCRDLDVDLQRVKDLGARCVVCCLDDDELQFLGTSWDDYRASAHRAALDVLRIPLPEGLCPLSPAALDADLARLTAQYTLHGAHVLVHCRGGVGRAGLVACCWMLRLGLCGWIAPWAGPPVAQELDADVRKDTIVLVQRAIAVVRRRRSVKAIETLEQVRFLVEYVDWLRENVVGGEVRVGAAAAGVSDGAGDGASAQGPRTSRRVDGAVTSLAAAAAAATAIAALAPTVQPIEQLFPSQPERPLPSPTQSCTSPSSSLSSSLAAAVAAVVPAVSTVVTEFASAPDPTSAPPSDTALSPTPAASTLASDSPLLSASDAPAVANEAATHQVPAVPTSTPSQGVLCAA
ncbi:phosphatases II [Coniophora puteana RWD-64-598 SS2]|uniref:Phosphatases II n=1 Tax=Coniophora puteana (strain RWD-64-598) TaxID=741705 RepID=A0A5M3MWW9_CONPW|nr:phosphatases II [Coniophora puteana RWD-64-598 SS2]EIW83254.1 phosphatases II [Coniophora puteana RWD-64-598 SS2]